MQPYGLRSILKRERAKAPRSSRGSNEGRRMFCKLRAEIGLRTMDMALAGMFAIDAFSTMEPFADFAPTFGAIWRAAWLYSSRPISVQALLNSQSLIE